MRLSLKDTSIAKYEEAHEAYFDAIKYLELAIDALADTNDERIEALADIRSELGLTLEHINEDLMRMESASRLTGWGL